MKRSASKIIGLALLLLVGCGAAGGPLAENAAEASFLELEETDWQAVSIDAGDFGMTEQPIGDPGSYGGSASLPLDKLIAFALASDGAASEDLFDELRQRFLEAPNTVLIYLTLMGNVSRGPDRGASGRDGAGARRRHGTAGRDGTGVSGAHRRADVSGSTPGSQRLPGVLLCAGVFEEGGKYKSFLDRRGCACHNMDISSID